MENVLVRSPRPAPTSRGGRLRAAFGLADRSKSDAEMLIDGPGLRGAARSAGKLAKSILSL